MADILFKNATLATLDPLWVGHGDLRISGGQIAERGDDLAPQPAEEVVDCQGKLIMPGLVCAHHHLYSALSRGMPGPASPPANFVDILEKVWWRLDRALDPDSVRISGLVGALDALRVGTTTIIDHHASPGSAVGSLEILESAVAEVGLRGVYCYEVSDRGGEAERDAGLEAHAKMLERGPTGMSAALVGGHACFTMGDETLERAATMANDAGVGLHIHVAEALSDVEDSHANHGMGLVDRLEAVGALGPKTLIAHATHLTSDELAKIDASGAWLLHNPRSNMNNRVGYADVESFGARRALGTDGIGADMFEEAKVAYFKAADANTGWAAEECVGLLAGGQKLASELLGVELGTLNVGAEADLIVLDYDPPTPLHSGNLAWHFIFAMSSVTVRDSVIAGQWRLRAGAPVGIDPAPIQAEARAQATAMWERMAALSDEPMWPRTNQQ